MKFILCKNPANALTSIWLELTFWTGKTHPLSLCDPNTLQANFANVNLDYIKGFMVHRKILGSCVYVNQFWFSSNFSDRNKQIHAYKHVTLLSDYQKAPIWRVDSYADKSVNLILSEKMYKQMLKQHRR